MELAPEKMQVFEQCVTVMYMMTVAYITVEATQPGMNQNQDQIRSVPQSNLATSRLYLPSARSSSLANKTGTQPAERYPVPTDWHCESISQWRDLGEFHYPRFVKQSVCVARQCYNDFYSCVPEYYPLTVLKVRDRDVTNDEMALPPQLRNRWMFELIQVSVACICGA